MTEIVVVNIPYGGITHPQSFLADVASRIGAVFRVRLTTGEEKVYLVGPEANSLVFGKTSGAFSFQKGWASVLDDRFGGTHLLRMSEDEHFRYRKAFDAPFSYSSLLSRVHRIATVAERRISSWVTETDIDVHAQCRGILFEVLCDLLLGIGDPDQSDGLRRLFYELIRGIDYTSETVTDFAVKQLEALRTTDALLLAQIRTLPSVGGPNVPILTEIGEALARDGLQHDAEAMLAHAKVLLLAGHETSAVLAAWLIYMLAMDATRRAPIETIVTGIQSSCLTPSEFVELINKSDLASYFLEAGRLHSPTIDVPRLVQQNIILGGGLGTCWNGNTLEYWGLPLAPLCVPLPRYL